jgi:hypothetical protein
MAGIFLTIFSGVLAVMLALDAYFRYELLGARWIWLMAAMGAWSLLLSVFHFFILTGRPRWVWGVVVLFIGCLCVVLPTVEYRPDKILYFLGVLFPLLGLLALNSDRHREFRKVIVVLRDKRKRFIGIREARRLRVKSERLRGGSASYPRDCVGIASSINIFMKAARHISRRSKNNDKPLVVSDFTIALIKLVCWASGAFLSCVLCVKLYFVYGSIISGVVVGANRQGPAKLYMVADEPWLFGLSMLVHIFTIAACALFLKLLLLLRE